MLVRQKDRLISIESHLIAIAFITYYIPLISHYDYGNSYAYHPNPDISKRLIT